MTNYKLIKEIILERNPKAIFLDDMFDKALIGSAISYEKKYVAVYDADKYIKILSKEKNINIMEAFEQFQNSINISIPSGNKTIFFSDFKKAKESEIK